MKKKIILIASAAILVIAGAVFAFTLQNKESITATTTATTVATPAKADACCMPKEGTSKTTAAESSTSKDACCAKK